MKIALVTLVALLNMIEKLKSNLDQRLKEKKKPLVRYPEWYPDVRKEILQRTLACRLKHLRSVRDLYRSVDRNRKKRLVEGRRRRRRDGNMAVRLLAENDRCLRRVLKTEPKWVKKTIKDLGIWEERWYM